MKLLFLSLLILALFTISAEAANRFAVCTTTCTWDGASTAMWSTTTGGATGASVPGAADDTIFDGATCVGGTTCTITVNTNPTINSITMGNCTASTTGCILDFSAHNNNINMIFFQASGSGVRTLKMGNGTWTITGSGTWWNIATATNFTFNANSSNLVFQINANASATFTSVSGPVYNIVTINANTSSATAGTFIFAQNSITIGTLNILPPVIVQFPSSPNGLTITNAINWAGTPTKSIRLESNGGNQGIINLASGSVITYANLFNMSNTGVAMTATNSFNNGRVGTGFTVTGPSGGGGACILGGWLLWRDLPNHINDNYPAWLDKAS